MCRAKFDTELNNILSVIGFCAAKRVKSCELYGFFGLFRPTLCQKTTGCISKSHSFRRKFFTCKTGLGTSVIKLSAFRIAQIRWKADFRNSSVFLDNQFHFRQIQMHACHGFSPKLSTFMKQQSIPLSPKHWSTKNKQKVKKRTK